MALTRLIPRLHNALPLANVEQPAIESVYLALFFAYKRYFEDPFAGLAARHPEFFHGGNILDVGANVGYTATVFAKAVEPRYHVYAFEPEARNVRRMRSVLERRGLSQRIEVIEAAVGDTPGHAHLRSNPHHPGDHRIVAAAASDTVGVQMTTIDDFVEKSNVDPVAFVKIDVQGLELAVSRGMSRLLARTPAMRVAFEYMPEAGRELLTFYRDRRFTLRALTHRGELVDCTDEALERLWRARGYADILASR